MQEIAYKISEDEELALYLEQHEKVLIPDFTAARFTAGILYQDIHGLIYRDEFIDYFEAMIKKPIRNSISKILYELWKISNQEGYQKRSFLPEIYYKEPLRGVKLFAEVIHQQILSEDALKPLVNYYATSSIEELL